MPETNSYIILLRAPHEVDVSAIAEQAAPILGLHPSDASRAIAMGHGVIGRGLSAPHADALCAVLDAVGAAHVRLPEVDLVEIPRPSEIATLNFRQEQDLVLVDTHNDRHDVPWAALLATVIGRIEVSASRRRDLGEVLSHTGMRVMGALTRDERDYADTPAAQPVPVRHMLVFASAADPDMVSTYRVTAEAFSFTCLGEAQTPRSIENFRLLAAGIRERLGGIAHNVSEGPIIEPGLYSWPVYPSALDLERELFRLVQIAWAKRNA